MRFTKGDVTEVGNEPFLIPHVCNDRGAWGAGFVKALSRRWVQPERRYRALPQYELGTTQFVAVPGGWVANMVAQQGLPSRSNPHPLQYDALAQCLQEVAAFARDPANIPLFTPLWHDNICHWEVDLGEPPEFWAARYPSGPLAIYQGWAWVALRGDPPVTPPSLPIRMPRIGTGYGRGDWNRIESLIDAACTGLDVTVFDL